MVGSVSAESKHYKVVRKRRLLGWSIWKLSPNVIWWNNPVILLRTARWWSVVIAAVVTVGWRCEDLLVEEVEEVEVCWELSTAVPGWRERQRVTPLTTPPVPTAASWTPPSPPPWSTYSPPSGYSRTMPSGKTETSIEFSMLAILYNPPTVIASSRGWSEVCVLK